MKQLNLKVLLSLLFLLAINPIWSQSKLEQGWDAFNENDLKGARQLFIAATENQSTAEEAWISLTILNAIDRDDASALEALDHFFDVSKDPNPYLHALWYEQNLLNTSYRFTKERTELLKKMIASGKLNSTMLAKANSLMGTMLEESNKFDKGDLEFAKIGAIMNWQLLGALENISASGFNKQWEAIEHPEPEYIFQNDYFAPIQWFTIDNYRPGRWIRQGYHGYTDQSIYFAQNFLKFDNEKDLQIRLGVSGSVKVWLNDRLLFSQEEERNNGIDAYIFSAHFNRGYNRLLIQLGEGDEVDGMNFLVRLTDNDGQVFNAYTVSTSLEDYKKETQYVSKEIPSFSNVFFEEKVAKDHSVLNQILLAKSYLSYDQSYFARKTLLKTKQRARLSSYVSTQLMNLYIRQDARTLYSEEFERLKKIDPDYPTAIIALFNEALKEKNNEKAEELVNKYEKVMGECAQLYNLKIELAHAREEQQEMIELMNEAYNKYPYNQDFMDYKYQIYAQIDGNYGGALGVLKRFLKLNYDTDVMENMADHFADLGNHAEVIKIMKAMIENEPYKIGFKADLADYYAGMQKYQEAIDVYKNLMVYAPYAGYYMGALAQAYSEIKSPNTKETYEKAMIYSPQNFELKKNYREYTDKKPIWEYFEEVKLDKLFANSPAVSDYPEDNSLIIKYETQKVVYKNGGSQEKNYILVKVFNATGVDTWKDYEIGESNVNVERAEVLKANGSKLKAEVRGSRVVFTNLEPNDAILLIYSTKSSGGGALQKHFWDNVYFNITYPYLDRKYNLLVEEGLIFESKFNFGGITPTVTKMDDEFSMHSWYRANQPSIKTEPYMPSFCDFSEVLYLSTIPDWNWINQWYFDLYNTKAKSDYEVKEVAAQIIAGHENLSDREKIHLVYDYVVKNIRYSSIPFRQNGVIPQKASKVINTKIGDCKDVSTLFIALCRELGYKADIVLVNTRDNGEKDLSLPNIGFNHAIAKVYIDDTYYIVELTSDLNAFSTMGQYLKNAFVLEINGVKSAPYLLDAKTRVPNAVKRTTEVEIKGTDLKITRTALRFGDYAASSRSTYRDIGAEKRLSEMQTAISDEFPRSKVTTLAFDSNLYNTNDSLFYKYTFDVTDAFINFNGNLLIEIPFAIKQSSMDFINNPTRKYGLNFWEYINDDYNEEVCTINIPANLSLVNLPKDIIHSSEFADYSLKFKTVGNKVIITRRIVYKRDKVELSQYQAFSDFYAKVIKADKTQIGFKEK